MNEVKKVILFLLCCAIPFSFYAQKARQNAATKKWGYEQTENKGWWENSKIVFCGDFGQNDLRHKKGSQVSGYHDFVKIIERMKEKSGTEVQIVEYKPSDVVRSGIVRDFIISCYELNI